MKSQIKNTLLLALDCFKGDDLERAELAFKNMTEKQLDEQYGYSGKTCREILTEYRNHRSDCIAAQNWVNNNL